MLPQSHQQFRRSVCVGCHKPSQNHQRVTDKLSATIRKQIFSGYSIQNEMLPIGICGSCRALVRRKNPFKKKFDYDELTKKFPRKNVRDGVCQCYICLAGRSKKLMNLKGKPGPKPKAPTKPTKMTICTKCGQETGRGKDHRCTPGKRAQNIVNLGAFLKTSYSILTSLILCYFLS